MSNPTSRADPIPERRHRSPRVSLLIDQLRQRVAEQRDLEAAARGERHKAYRAEIARLRAEVARLQRQLASAVRRELSDEQSLG